MLKIATWNVNSIRARQDRAIAWLNKAAPDIVCLQELKTSEENFPFEVIGAAGYHAAVFGQKTYNGVAILSRSEPSDVVLGLGDDVDDPQARLISARIDDIQIISAYVPNGSVVGSDKWDYKLAWYKRLLAYLSRRFSPDDPVLLCGDFNIAPDDRDVANPELWADSVICHPDGRSAHRAIMDWGFVDTLRLHHTDQGPYSWWDYRHLGFPKNNGLRIDHILATHPIVDRCKDGFVDREERKGVKPSDHAPVLAVFE